MGERRFRPNFRGAPMVEGFRRGIRLWLWRYVDAELLAVSHLAKV